MFRLRTGWRRCRAGLAANPLILFSLFFICLLWLTPGCIHEITLSWQDTSQDEKGFKIYRLTGQDKQMIGVVDANVTSFVDRSAPTGACYIVTAFNDAGESQPTNLACRR